MTKQDDKAVATPKATGLLSKMGTLPKGKARSKVSCGKNQAAMYQPKQNNPDEAAF